MVYHIATVLSVIYFYTTFFHGALFFSFCNCSAFQHGSLKCGQMLEGENMAVSVHSKSAFITLMLTMLSSHKDIPTANFPMS